jgi:hypothetical protein
MESEDEMGMMQFICSETSQLKTSSCNEAEMADINDNVPQICADFREMGGGDHATLTAPGDWETILKSNGDDTFAYTSTLWGDDQLLNEVDPIDSPGNAKYPAYNDLEFDAIKVCVGLPTNCIEAQAFLEPIPNAAALFDGPYRRQGVVQDEWDRVFDPSGQNEACGMQRPGFNTLCADGNQARWGYCANIPSQPCQEDDADDADAVIGVGLVGQDCCPMGGVYACATKYST